MPHELPPVRSDQNIASPDTPSGNAGALWTHLRGSSSVGGAESVVILTKCSGSSSGEGTTGLSPIVTAIQCCASNISDVSVTALDTVMVSSEFIPLSAAISPLLALLLDLMLLSRRLSLQLS